MIYRTNLQPRRFSPQESTLKSLEKSLEILEDRHRRKLIEEVDYIEKSEKIRLEINRIKNSMNNNM